MKKILFLLAVIASGVSFAQDGSMDNSFGNDGVVITDLDNSYDFGWSVVEQADHRLVIAGTTSLNTNQYFPYLLRYMPDGSVDTSFGTNGKVSADHGIVGINGYDYLFIDNQQRIVAAGPVGYNSEFAIERYLTNGDLDNSFGNNGSLFIPNGNYATMTLLNDGSLLLLKFSNTNEITIDHYLSNGNLDGSFGVNGSAISSFVGEEFIGRELKVDTQNNIYFLGKRDYSQTSNVVLMKFKPDGYLDTNFGNNGQVEKNIDAINSTSVDFDFTNDDKIVIAGSSGVCLNESQSIRQSFFIKYNTNGSPDASFGNNGTVLLQTSAFEIFQLLIQTNQRMVVVGRIQDCFEASYYIVKRYFSDGIQDNSFLGGGHEIDTHKTIMQHDGKLVSVGNTFWYEGKEDIVVLRHNNTVLGSPEFENNKTIIYPNPSDGNITMEVSFYNQDDIYQITDVTGKIILTGEIRNKQTHIDLTTFQSGIYFLKTDNGVFKLLKN